MAQHDYNIANQSGAAFRQDLNNALEAIVSQNSGTAEPSVTYAYQWWADTTAGLLKQRNAANSAWITIRELDGDVVLPAGAAATPSLYFDGDANTGVFSPGADQLGITTGGVGRLVVDASGNVNIDSGTLYVDAANDRVGIGTGTPDTLLHVSSDTGSASPSPTEVRIATTANAGDWSTALPWGRLSFYSSDTTGGARVHASINAIANGVGGGTSSLTFNTADSGVAAAERMRINATGQVGINTASPTYLLDLPNNADNATGRGRSNQWATYSDGRIKTNREQLPYGVNAVMQLEPLRYFHHNSATDENGNVEILEMGEISIGLVAQDVEDIIPEIVNVPEDLSKDLCCLDYAKLSAVLVKAVQEQQAMISELQNKIAALEGA
jgi:hypothetical protein